MNKFETSQNETPERAWERFLGERILVWKEMVKESRLDSLWRDVLFLYLNDKSHLRLPKGTFWDWGNNLIQYIKVAVHKKGLDPDEEKVLVKLLEEDINSFCLEFYKTYMEK